jgi:hypothetical protein
MGQLSKWPILLRIVAIPLSRVALKSASAYFVRQHYEVYSECVSRTPCVARSEERIDFTHTHQSGLAQRRVDNTTLVR